MKVAVLNYSGNVGKTTIAKHLLMPRMGADCEWLPVESINMGGDAQTNFRGREFKDVLKRVEKLTNAVVDIGSSNIETAFEQLRKMGDAHEAFDFFVIPTVAAEKQQADTMKIVTDMLDMEIPPERIKIVFNQVPDGTNFQRVFGALVTMLKDLDVEASSSAVIYENDAFGLLTPSQTIEDAICNGRDIRAEIAATKNPELREVLASELIASRLAKGVQKEMDRVFHALFSTAVAL